MCPLLRLRAGMSGQVVASATSHTELYWAVCGVGSAFGVATKIVLRLNDVSECVGGHIVLPYSRCGMLKSAAAEPAVVSVSRSSASHDDFCCCCKPLTILQLTDAQSFADLSASSLQDLELHTGAHAAEHSSCTLHCGHSRRASSCH